MRGWFPGVVRVWVTLPFDKILDSSTVLGLSRLQDCLNFIMVIFLTNNFRRGIRELGPWAVVSLYGDRRELWNTGWILHVAGNCNLQLTPHVVSTLKGSGCFVASLALGWVVWMLVPSSQTRSPSLNSTEEVTGCGRFMTSPANLSNAVTSDRRRLSCTRRSSTVGLFVTNCSGGVNLGW